MRRALILLALMVCLVLPGRLALADGKKGKLPHVEFDVDKRQVRVECEALNVDAPLEFFCCVTGTNEHESVLRTAARPSDIQIGLLAIGLKPGMPLTYSEATNKWLAPHGPPLHMTLEYEKDGKAQSCPAYRWLRNLKTKKSPPAFSWVYTGSRVMSDGKFAADVTGYVVSIVNFDLTLIDVPFLASSANETLEWERNAELMPKTGSRVWMIIEPVGDKEEKKDKDAKDAGAAASGTAKASLCENGKASNRPTGPYLERSTPSGSVRSTPDRLAGLLASRVSSDTNVKNALTAKTADIGPALADGMLHDHNGAAIRIADGIDVGSALADGIVRRGDGSLGRAIASAKADPTGFEDPPSCEPSCSTNRPSPGSTSLTAGQPSPLGTGEREQDCSTDRTCAAEQAAPPATAPATQPLSDVHVDQEKVDNLEVYWKKKVSPHAAALREAAEAHYKVMNDLRREQQRLIDEADRIQRAIDKLEREYQDMTTPRPEAAG